jgi:hypothetical protein
LFNQNAGPVVFPLNPHGLRPAVHVSAAAPAFVFLAGRRTKGALMDTVLAVFLLLMLIGQAFGGERMSCEVQPMRGDGREWHYRTKVGGDPRICWYPGERMKPRSELYWDTDTTRLSAPPSDAVEPKDATILERDAVERKDAPILEPHPDGDFAERWRALDGR